MRVPVDSQDLRAASGEFKAVEPGVAANVENGPPHQNDDEERFGRRPRGEYYGTRDLVA
jgi:hypothetical protein